MFDFIFFLTVDGFAYATNAHGLKTWEGTQTAAKHAIDFAKSGGLKVKVVKTY